MVTFAAPSGTGKTTLLEGVIAELRGRGYRVGALKHDAHRLKLDTPGKDSWRLRRAGAWRVVVASDEQLGMFSSVSGRMSLGGLAAQFFGDADLILTEGFRRAGLPTIRVHRAARGADPGWEEPSNVVAVVTDVPDLAGSVPHLPLGDPTAVADFVEARWLRRAPVAAVTVVVAVLQPGGVGRILAAARRALGDRVLAVTGPGVAPVSGATSVPSLRPGEGMAGALLTGMAASSTPGVLLWGPAAGVPPVGLLSGLVSAAPASADVVPLLRAGRPQPEAAIYGPRCLGVLRASLRSGEPTLDGWWGHVRVHPVAESGLIGAAR